MSTPKPVLPAFFTVKQTAEHLSVCDKTIRRMITSGALASHKVGRSIRISKVDLERFLARSR